MGVSAVLSSAPLIGYNSGSTEAQPRFLGNAMAASSLIGLMNDTKWDELRLAMYGLAELSPQWRTKDRETGYVCPWDSEWYHHFYGGYKFIEWVELRADSPEQRSAIRSCLKKIRAPGIETTQGFRVIGWISPGEPVAYIE
jgi:hypothetical protein